MGYVNVCQVGTGVKRLRKGIPSRKGLSKIYQNYDLYSKIDFVTEQISIYAGNSRPGVRSLIFSSTCKLTSLGQQQLELSWRLCWKRSVALDMPSRLPRVVPRIGKHLGTFSQSKIFMSQLYLKAQIMRQTISEQSEVPMRISKSHLETRFAHSISTYLREYFSKCQNKPAKNRDREDSYQLIRNKICYDLSQIGSLPLGRINAANSEARKIKIRLQCFNVYCRQIKQQCRIRLIIQLRCPGENHKFGNSRHKQLIFGQCHLFLLWHRST